MTTIVMGSDAWWQLKQGPEWVREEDGSYCVTFWWRDPNGSETSSPIQRVWIYITGVTDHHQQSVPQTLQRIEGTDVWQWQHNFSADWRGSYCFIPSIYEDDFAACVFSDHIPDSFTLQEGWRKLLPHAIADPLNNQSWIGGRGHPVCALALPAAPAQPGWDEQQDTPYTEPYCLIWHSETLANTRRVWIHTTGEQMLSSEDVLAKRPLAILLDGQFWAENMPIWPALANLTAKGRLPPAVYVLIDAIDSAHRSHELTCNKKFWLAIQQELLPKVQRYTTFSTCAKHTIVAGQSFGGLSALYAALHWPKRFGCVLSQSGSYWWPNRQDAQQGWLLEQLREGKLQAQGLRIILVAGRREPLILAANQALVKQLQQKQVRPLLLIWSIPDSGHDVLCWRGCLTQGLVTLWQPITAHFDPPSLLLQE